MNMERRDFIKVLSVGAASAGGLSNLQARPTAKMPPNAVGILYDATLCIGCRSCEVACKKVNDMPMDVGSPLEKEHGVNGIWDAGDLSETALNKIKVYRNGNGQTKDQVTDGYGFIKRACMHCVDPDCVSACPVTALEKQTDTGIVTYNKDACIGCRYCQVACPYNIPKFEYDEPIPEIVKCEMCSHLQADGEMPACCKKCPTGSSLFGSVDDLLNEARKRIQLKEGDEYEYPLSSFSSGQTQRRKAKKYVQYIYGESEGGGTQYIMLSAIPFSKLGLPKLSNKSGASKSETIQHSIYKGMIAPIVLLGGLLFAAHRSTKTLNDEGGAK